MNDEPARGPTEQRPTRREDHPMATERNTGSTTTATDERWLDELESRSWRALQYMHLRVDGELARRLAAESDLSYSDYVVLVALTDQPDHRMRSFALADLIGWEKSRLSHHVNRMVARGLVERQKCDADRRGSYVVVTQAGKAAIEAAAPGHVDAVRELFIDVLTPAQLAAIADAAETVLAAFDGTPIPDATS
jgi:DNA-binding MarR family transcriptional regulator